MNKVIKKVLSAIEKKGFEAYLVGGYVRDLLLGKTSYDIDICTNATPKELITIFPVDSAKNLGGIDFKIKEYHFEIMTYREEIRYENRRPAEYNYINNLVLDLQRRDFTINAICMNIKGEIIDLVNGVNDLTNNKLVMIGSTALKLKEDPLRILRAIRFATVLNFNLDNTLGKEIKRNYKEINILSNTRVKEELDKILLSSYVKRGLGLLKDFNILDLLKISYDVVVPVKSLEGMYAQLDFKYDFPFTKPEKDNIKALKEIISTQEITKQTIYNYGLYLTIVAGEIMGISNKTINKMFKELPIHDKKDINIKSEEIVKVLNIEYSKKISIIMGELENLILNGVVKNKKSDIIKYLVNNKARWV